MCLQCKPYLNSETPSILLKTFGYLSRWKEVKTWSFEQSMVPLKHPPRTILPSPQNKIKFFRKTQKILFLDGGGNFPRTKWKRNYNTNFLYPEDMIVSCSSNFIHLNKFKLFNHVTNCKYKILILWCHEY